MKRPGLIHGILVAALLSLVAPLLYGIAGGAHLLRLNRARMGMSFWA